jgi:hypothetical protein
MRILTVVLRVTHCKIHTLLTFIVLHPADALKYEGSLWVYVIMMPSISRTQGIVGNKAQAEKVARRYLKHFHVFSLYRELSFFLLFLYGNPPRNDTTAKHRAK